MRGSARFASSVIIMKPIESKLQRCEGDLVLDSDSINSSCLPIQETFIDF